MWPHTYRKEPQSGYYLCQCASHRHTLVIRSYAIAGTYLYPVVIPPFVPVFYSVSPLWRIPTCLYMGRISWYVTIDTFVQNVLKGYCHCDNVLRDTRVLLCTYAYALVSPSRIVSYCTYKCNGRGWVKTTKKLWQMTIWYYIKGFCIRK